MISVGYRVTCRIATRFRIWATVRLSEYLVNGFMMDHEKLKNLAGGTYWRELLDRIRDIRSSEKVLHRQVLDLFATSIEYDAQARETKQSFAAVQRNLHFYQSISRSCISQLAEGSITPVTRPRPA